MVREGDQAPAFTAPLANGEVGEFDMEAAIEAETPVVLAFFPGAFTSTCTHELKEFQDRLATFEDAGVTVYGVSVDSPFALNEFRDQLGLSFDLISDTNRNLIDLFDISMDFASLGVHDVSKRAVFVVDGGGTISYAWVSDDPGIEPDYDEVFEAASTA